MFSVNVYSSNQVDYSKSCLLGGFPLTATLLGYSTTTSLSRGTCVPCRTICKPGLRCFFFPLSQRIIANTPSGQKSRLEERKQYSEIRGHGHLDHFLMQLTCAFRSCSSMITCVSLPFDNEVLLCTSNFMAWPVGQHSIHDGKLKLHGNVVTHG